MEGGGGGGAAKPVICSELLIGAITKNVSYQFGAMYVWCISFCSPQTGAPEHISKLLVASSWNLCPLHTT